MGPPQMLALATSLEARGCAGRTGPCWPRLWRRGALRGAPVPAGHVSGGAGPRGAHRSLPCNRVSCKRRLAEEAG
jgi:hypothetical protein